MARLRWADYPLSLDHVRSCGTVDGPADRSLHRRRRGISRDRCSHGFDIAGTVMFPVAPDRGARARQATLIEEMSADALHGRGLPRGPYSDVGIQPRAGDRGDEGITRTRTGLELIPLHDRAGMGGQIEASRYMLHLDENPDLGARRQRSQKHADGGQGRFVTGQQEAASCWLDVVSAPRAGDRSAIACPCFVGPCREGPMLVADDVDVEIAGTRLIREQGERADDWTAPILQEELVPVPDGYHDLLRIQRQEESYARGRQPDVEPRKLGSGESDPRHVQAARLDPSHFDTAKRFGFATRPDRCHEVERTASALRFGSLRPSPTAVTHFAHSRTAAPPIAAYPVERYMVSRNAHPIERYMVSRNAYSRTYPAPCLIAGWKAIEAALLGCDTCACRCWEG